jgi:hypothetical protein
MQACRRSPTDATRVSRRRRPRGPPWSSRSLLAPPSASTAPPRTRPTSRPPRSRPRAPPGASVHPLRRPTTRRTTGPMPTAPSPTVARPMRTTTAGSGRGTATSVSRAWLALEVGPDRVEDAAARGRCAEHAGMLHPPPSTPARARRSRKAGREVRDPWHRDSPEETPYSPASSIRTAESFDVRRSPRGARRLDWRARRARSRPPVPPVAPGPGMQAGDGGIG